MSRAWAGEDERKRMSHAATGLSRASPASCAHPSGEQRHRGLEPVSDLTLASAAAQAVRMVPGVVDLSPGYAAPAATYGPGQRVAGIVVHRPTTEEIVLEVHVVISEAHCALASADSSSKLVERDSHDAEESGPVSEIASRVRNVVCATVQSMAAQARVQVDVFIDDLR